MDGTLADCDGVIGMGGELDKVIFTGTAAEVLLIKEPDGRAIGSGVRGPITEKLQTMYFDQVMGSREHHADWSTPVG